MIYTILDIYSTSNGLAVITSEAGRCPICRRMTYFFRTSQGRSTCLDCAPPVTVIATRS